MKGDGDGSCGNGRRSDLRTAGKEAAGVGDKLDVEGEGGKSKITPEWEL